VILHRCILHQILQAFETRGFIEIGGRSVVIKQDAALRRGAGVD